MANDATIQRYADLVHSAALEAGIDAVFFEASNVKTFASDQARAEFRERWLGRYLVHDRHLAFVALSKSGEVLGYVAGSLDDPAQAARFSDIGYFAAFKDLTRCYPAHLHVNLRAIARNAGLGSALVAGFVAEAEAAGVPGVHVVTGRGARNIAFYNRNGFLEAGSDGDNGRAVVFLARDLRG